jgi:LysM repeat protein/lysophospholipase L1-like esterase
MRFIFIIVFLFFTLFAVDAQVDSTAVSSYLEKLKPSPELLKSFEKLKRIQGKAKEKYTIIHFGDSHVQGDSFSSEIRNAFQDNFGAAGQGIIFPYSLSKSYGPKGVVASFKGSWTGTNIMDGTHKNNIGLSGYTLFTSKDSASINFEISDKFKGVYSNKIAIYSSGGNLSFDYEVNKQLNLVEEQVIASNLILRVYESNSPIQSFGITTIKKSDEANSFYFHGFEFLFDKKGGVDYHRCGVVGAQFTHLINNAKLVQSMLKQVQPDLLIFSFGSNESYSQNIDGPTYFKSIADYLSEIKRSVPHAAILITTAPDTRSQGKTPPSQILVNNQLVNLATHLDLALYDLYQAMGGWGSMYRWHSNKLAVDDKLHFNAKGYSLQGKMLTNAFFEAYNNVNADGQIALPDLAQELNRLVMPAIPAPAVVGDQITEVTIAEKKTAKNKSKKKSKDTVYVVKSGDMVSKIAVKYKISVQKILKANKLQENTIIRPGQKLKIPRN